MSGAKSEQSKQDAEKWIALEGKSVALKNAAAELSKAVNAFGLATGIDELNEFCAELDTLSKSDTVKLVDDMINLTTSMLGKINAINERNKELKLDDDCSKAVKKYLETADKFALEATRFNKEMIEINKRWPVLQGKLAELQFKMGSSSSPRLPGKDESGNTPVEKFAKACARFGAALVTLPLLLGGIVVAIAGSIATLGTWIPGVIIGAGVAIATQDVDSAVAATTLVTQSIMLVGGSMFVAGIAAGMYAAHGDNAFEDHQKKSNIG